MIYLITSIVFATVLLAGLGIYYFAVRKSIVTQRMESLFPEQQFSVRPRQESGTWEYKLSRIGASVQLSQGEQSKYTRLLVAAGMRKESIFLFLGSKIVLAALLPTLYFSVMAAPGQPSLGTQTLLMMAVCAIVGYLLPSYWLYARKARRQERIFHTLPDVLDLVTVCVEAGLSMDAALIRTIDTPQFAGDPLAQEIKTATMEIRAGKPRIEALKDMAQRTMVEDIKSFVSMLAQTERFGTSLSKSLRSFADSLRTKRRQIAEEAAAKTTIKMIFPLVLFIMPALLVVVLGPAVVQIFKIFK